MSDTPLGSKIKALIAANGPMSVADYMALCLGDLEHGYYATRDPLGAKGDFVTAPEISQMFGEIVGAWLVHMWRMIGAPKATRLVELGPGRGTLMADILRVAAKAPDFRASIAVDLVETSPPLRALQRERLAGAKVEIAWRNAFSDVPPGPLLLVANEFFDALPVRQFVRVGREWRERVIGLDEDDELAFGIGAGTLSVSAGEATVTSPLRGAILELCPAADAIAKEIARRVVVENGMALIIDYGHVETATGETLQAVRGHRFTDPLDAPGEADLTAHVDFAALARAAKGEGASAHGPLTQGDFLTALGLNERAQKLAANADAKGREALSAAVARLAGPDAMGTLFKILSLTRPGVSPPPFASPN